MKETPSGTSILPSNPERKNSGRKLAIIIRDELNIGYLTSFEASSTTSITGAFPLFSLRRLYTFSTSTTASSTSEPIAIAIPPRVIVFMLSPRMCRMMIVTITDTGRVTTDIAVVRTFIRKKNKIAITKREPSISDI